MSVFDTLDYWFDKVPRPGVENMAVDELLMRGIGDRPVLRLYGWSEPTVSFGYFLPYSEATAAFSGDELTYVRRWTGGGVVDHRVDVTYTVCVPRSHPLATARGAESYREIHQVLAEVLGSMGVKARLTVVDEGDGGLVCFSNPVAYDLTDDCGCKMAGAGQRRTRYGLLHQGSLVAGVDAVKLGGSLAHKLAHEVADFTPPQSLLDESRDLAQERYGTEAWLYKKP